MFVLTVLRRIVVSSGHWSFDNLSGSHLTLMMTSAQVVEKSVTTTDNSPSQDYTHQGDHTTLSHVTPGYKLFTVWWRMCEHNSNNMQVLKKQFVLFNAIFYRKIIFRPALHRGQLHCSKNLHTHHIKWLYVLVLLHYILLPLLNVHSLLLGPFLLKIKTYICS